MYVPIGRIAPHIHCDSGTLDLNYKKGTHTITASLEASKVGTTYESEGYNSSASMPVLGTGTAALAQIATNIGISVGGKFDIQAFGDEIITAGWEDACALNKIVDTDTGTAQITLNWPKAGAQFSQANYHSHSYKLSQDTDDHNTVNLLCDGSTTVASLKHGQYNVGWNAACNVVGAEVHNGAPRVKVPKKYDSTGTASGSEYIGIGCYLAQGSGAGKITAVYGPSYGGTAHTAKLSEKSIEVTSSQVVNSSNNKQSRTKIVVKIDGVTSQTYYSDYYDNYSAGYAAGSSDAAPTANDIKVQSVSLASNHLSFLDSTYTANTNQSTKRFKVSCKGAEKTYYFNIKVDVPATAPATT